MNALNHELMRKISRVENAAREKVDADPRRLHFHLMPPVGWLNDPNGLCWYQGKYHVFYQYSPFDAKRGVIFWGHWTSPDLLHWHQEPVFLCPDMQEDCSGVYSGSALVEEDALYLYYTGNVKYTGAYNYVTDGREHNTMLAISGDGIHADSKQVLLRNTDYPENMTLHVRDPKVWKQDGMYYMVLGARTKADRGVVLVYESADKRNWKQINTITTPKDFGFMWECPDLFCIGGQYILSLSPQGITRQGNRFQNVYSCGYIPLYGDFRGEYTLGAYQEADCGFDYYAPQSFEAPDGRRIVISWMGMPDADYSNPTVEAGWQHCMSVPRELHWNGERVISTPIRELEQLRENHRAFVMQKTSIDCELSACADLLIRNTGDTLRISFGSDASVVYADGTLTLTLHEESGCGRTERIAEVKSMTDLRILMDSSSLELFINNGEQVMSTRFYPQNTGKLHIEGSCQVDIYDMRAMQITYLEHTV